MTKETEDKTEEKAAVLPLERPTFYHERVSYLAATEYRAVNSAMGQAAMLLDTTYKADATPDEIMQVKTAKSQALLDVTELTKERDAFLLPLVKSLPRSWLVEGAPAVIGDGEWFTYVRSDHFNEIISAYQSDQNRRREETKN